jgi:hypothetical protein
MVEQQYTVCKPVSTTRQVTEICMQPTTQLVSVPTKGHCGICGKNPCGGGCKTVAQTCYTPVPVVKNVVETQMVREVQTRQVPVTTCQMTYEDKVEDVKVTQCRMVQEVVTEKRTVVVGFQCVPKTITKKVPVMSCETVTETCYRPVTRMVPVVCAPAPAPAVEASAQASAAAPTAQSQAAPSSQQ